MWPYHHPSITTIGLVSAQLNPLHQYNSTNVHPVIRLGMMITSGGGVKFPDSVIMFKQKAPRMRHYVVQLISVRRDNDSI